MKITNETQNNTLQVVEGNILQLVCSVQSGKPKEILQWITDTTVIKEGGQNGTITYRLNASSSDHMKIFICSAMNEALYHPITKQVRLDVLGKPKVTVSIIPDGRLLQEYQDAELCCKTEGNSAATHITWIKDTTNIKILNDTRHCISFTPLLRQNTGKYTCTAMNSIGFSSATKHIRVLYPSDVSINTTESKQTITLKCHASGDPGSYEFAEWDHQSEFGKHIRYIENTRNGTLLLEKHNYQNSGLYKCRVKNGIPDMDGKLYQEEQFMVFYKDDDFTSTFAYGYCWIIMGSIVGGVVLLCGWSHIYCCLKRAKTCSSNIHQITPEDNYDEVETLNYNNVMFDHVPNDVDMNNDNVSSIIDNNDIMLRADVVSSDDSSSFKQSGDGYENPYQAINPCDIEMHHYSSIVSCNYQNTIIFPLSELAETPNHLNIAMDGLINPWLVIYKRK
ncbi:unnamed protein product [Mytilus coruscus]|uniref:Ig-like domain-containing protein n=1 Tax=Mytilus coruscus TaxID=42192 RepID=A0A6J8BLT8_MYTCO|nr:unnamed protein product [Mytilus coruscus]